MRRWVVDFGEDDLNGYKVMIFVYSDEEPNEIQDVISGTWHDVDEDGVMAMLRREYPEAQIYMVDGYAPVSQPGDFMIVTTD